MSLNNMVKRLQDIMRNDAGINGDAQRIEQMVWILFLKVYDAKEEIWEFYDENYTSIIPEELRWRNWAVDHKDGKALTGDALLDFVNGKLFPTLKAIAIDENTPMSQIIVRTAFEDNNNYMKDGILLRQVINVIDEIDFEEYEDRHAFGEIYETILRSLQSAGNSGEFYTPRAVTDFMVQMIKPKLGESIADFACGTGGFLTSALKVLDAQVQSVDDRTVYSNSIYGIEKKALPFLLCATNMLLHDIDNPRIIHGNSLEKNVREYKESDRFDVILMNPPYGGNEKEGVKQNFPADLRSSETADLFMSVIMYRLKQNGRAPSFCQMASCSVRITPKWRSRKSCFPSLTSIRSSVCRTAFLRRTPLSRQTFFSSTGRIPQRRPGSTDWICRRDTRTSPRQSP